MGCERSSVMCAVTGDLSVEWACVFSVPQCVPVAHVVGMERRAQAVRGRVPAL